LPARWTQQADDFAAFDLQGQIPHYLPRL